MAITVTKADLENISGQTITNDRYLAIDASARNLIIPEVPPRIDINTATGRAERIINAVYTAVSVRLISNPAGARSVGLGSATIVYGGADDEIHNAGTLTDPEKEMLRGLRTNRALFVRMRPWYEGPDPTVTP